MGARTTKLIVSRVRTPLGTTVYTLSTGGYIVKTPEVRENPAFFQLFDGNGNYRHMGYSLGDCLEAAVRS